MRVFVVFFEKFDFSKNIFTIQPLKGFYTLEESYYFIDYNLSLDKFDKNVKFDDFVVFEINIKENIKDENDK